VPVAGLNFFVTIFEQETTTMRTIFLRALCVFLMLAGAAHAGEPVYALPDSERARHDLAVLLLPSSLELEMVDGLVYPGAKSMFRKGDTNVYVLPGEREVSLRYNEFFQTTPNDHDIIKSKIMTLKFVAEPGKTYRAKHADFRNAVQARSGVVNFVLQIVDDAGNNRVIAASQTQKNWRGEENTSSRPDLVSEAARNAVAGAAAVSSASASAPAPAAAGASGGLNALDLLKFTWQNADAANRAAFLEWVKVNP
jgi:uncharacterized protein YccT (UPF0319 family)